MATKISTFFFAKVFFQKVCSFSFYTYCILCELQVKILSRDLFFVCTIIVVIFAYVCPIVPVPFFLKQNKETLYSPTDLAPLSKFHFPVYEYGSVSGLSLGLSILNSIVLCIYPFVNTTHF